MMKRNCWKKVCVGFLLCLASAMAASAQTVTAFFNFNGADGAGMSGGSLIQGTDGNLYGSSTWGGKNNTGSLYGISLSGDLLAFHSFCAPGCLDGTLPYGGVIQAANGSFFGTTQYGGGNNGGILFEITSAPAFKVLGNFLNSEGPTQPPMQATNGNLYGTAPGGANNGGEIYEVTPNGTMSTFFNFCAPKCSAGAYGNGLVEAPNKLLYGVAGSGGGFGSGVFYSISLDGHYSRLHSFKKAEGAALNPVILASDGNFYGTSAGGGANSAGTIFKLTPNGQLTVLYNFCSQSNCTDGMTAVAPLVEGSDGNLYGTTELGGSVDSHNTCISGCGTLFQITPAGVFTSLYSFCTTTDCSTKYEPMTTLLQATDGNFYGSAGGGPISSGTIYELSMGLGPFVKANPGFAAAGSAIQILGTGLTGATQVSFNGTPAAFTVVSDTYIKTRVPAGATKGYITVTTSSGTLTSNVPFDVTP